MKINEKVYIGDGVYASFDGLQICLSTTRDEGEVEIFLEPIVWRSLKVFAKEWFGDL